MKSHFLLLAGAVALVACESATKPDPVGPPADAAVQSASVSSNPLSEGPVAHPTAMKSEGELVPIGWCDEAAGVAHAAAPGVGTMTHVGRFEIQQAGCVDFATGAITDGLGILTAANGDEIHVEYAGRILPGVVPLTMELEYVVIGGTGRFSHAEGEMDVAVIYTSETAWISEGGGWVRYVASDRSNR
jgi:hypothetical protein